MKKTIKKIGVLATGCFLFWFLGLSKSKNEPAPINKTMEVTSKIVEVATGAKIYQPAPRASAIVPIALKVTGTCVLVFAIAATLAFEKTDPNKANKDGDTPLHIASREGKTAVVKELLKHPEIKPNQQNTEDF